MLEAVWTIDAVAARFAEACHTAHRLPRVRPQGYFNVWPEFKRTAYERMARDDEPVYRFPPTPEDIERMLLVMRWVQWLEVDDRHLVWLRADRYEWAQIARRIGCCRQTASRRWRRAIEDVAERLNADFATA